MKVFVTGAAGYIGSHCLLELLKANFETLAFDNYTNTSPEALRRVKRLANRDFDIYEGDVRDNRLSDLLEEFRPEVVIHFAGFKAVGESHEQPLAYYDNNVTGSVNLLRAMDRANCKNIVFSSSATVYGEAQYLPYDEVHPLCPESPYANSKRVVEGIIHDWCNTGNGRTGAILRYFNPVGAHDSGDIGEDPNDIPNNLMPYIQQVAIGRRAKLTIHGNDYDTHDGTGVRDYIHVSDLARAHLAAVNYATTHSGWRSFNIGTGCGVSVLDMVNTFQAVSGRTINYEIGPRRAGDIGSMLANPTRAERELKWKATLGLEDMCRDAWNFQKRNPSGYEQ